jgi:DNA-binding transcriptional LysR family regulator
MDVELARTFLEVIGAGSFIEAAERLNVTQSTVSHRIKLLEEQLGTRLFVRNKGGAALTPAGVRFQHPAAALVRIWEQARQEAALPEGHSAILRVGGEAGLWNRWLHHWVPWMRQHAPDIALRCEVGLPDSLTQSLVEGLLDIAVLYSPHSRPSLRIELLAEEELILVEADPPAGCRGEHVYVDWGEDFRRKHRLSFPDFPSPALFIGLGTLGFDYLLRQGGTGYFPRSLVEPHLSSGRVRIVAEGRSFGLPIYAVYSAEAEANAIGAALSGLRAILSLCWPQAETPPAHPSSWPSGFPGRAAPRFPERKNRPQAPAPARASPRSE